MYSLYSIREPESRIDNRTASIGQNYLPAAYNKKTHGRF